MRVRELLLVLLGLVLAGALLLAFRVARRGDVAHAVLAGQSLPRENLALDLGRRYDVSAFVETSHPVVYRAVRILGVTTVGAQLGSASGDWLVLELPDKRVVYLQQAAVDILEQSSQEAVP